jgi:uncharacterized protein YjiS (DUF1127 family)
MEHPEMSQSCSLQTHDRGGAGAPPYRSFTGMVKAVWSRLCRRHAYIDLSSLDDRLLDDVGIPREAVRQFGKPPWWP